MKKKIKLSSDLVKLWLELSTLSMVYENYLTKEEQKIAAHWIQDLLDFIKEKGKK